jgi:hypothetical protein
MAKISTYPQPTPPQLGDYVIGTDISDLLMTKNYLLSDIITLATTTNQFVTIVGAQTVTGSKTFDYGTSTGVPAPVIINVPAQTQPAYSPDGLLIQINGQVPSTTPGSICGVNVQAHLLDNVCYYGDLFGDSGASVGIKINSEDSHSGNFLEFRKRIISPASDNIKFRVGSEGNTEIYSNSGTVLQASNGGLLATDRGIFTGAYAGIGLQAGTYGGIAVYASAGGTTGIATKSESAVGTALLTIGKIQAQSLPIYANNAAAVSGGLAVDFIYKTATGELRIVV